ncbi:MAG: hypothetical protein P4M01_01200 [Acidobacteriota bacterium]|nr:hypothetical protein [Acidobacteriota bacterium]
MLGIGEAKDVERIITEIECLERMYSLPDNRPLAEIAPGKQPAMYTDTPWIQQWRQDKA